MCQASQSFRIPVAARVKTGRAVGIEKMVSSRNGGGTMLRRKISMADAWAMIHYQSGTVHVFNGQYHLGTVINFSAGRVCVNMNGLARWYNRELLAYYRMD